MVMNNEDHGSAQATHDELCDGALEHYERLSSECSDWSSVIPEAIEFYRKHGGDEVSLDELYEKLAAIEHERWADWQKYVHSICIRNNVGDFIIPFGMVDHWERQINTPYADLSEKEKDSDREQVDRYWDLLKFERIRQA